MRPTTKSFDHANSEADAMIIGVWFSSFCIDGPSHVLEQLCRRQPENILLPNEEEVFFGFLAVVGLVV